MTPMKWWIEHPSVVRVAFGVWAVTVFTLTHWPGLKIEGAPVRRPDLFAHLGVFGLWGVLFAWSGFFGRRGSARNACWSFGIGVVYAAVDESLQLIPILNRHAGLDDFAANVLGIALGVTGASAVSHWRGAGGGTRRPA